MAADGGGPVIGLEQIARDIGGLWMQTSEVADRVEETSQAVASQTGSLQVLQDASQSLHEQAAQIVAALDSARRTGELGHTALDGGRSRMAETLGVIRALTEAVERTGTRIDTLVRAIARVETVARDINGICRQSNLIALNASVEAHRAGEAGRGFAILAREMKSLADQTGLSAAEIERTLAEAAAEARSLSETVGESLGWVEQTRSGTTEIDGIVAEIGTHLDSMLDQVVQVDRAAGQVRQQAAQVDQEVAALSDAAHQSSDTLARVTDQVNGLLSLSERLVRHAEQAGMATVDHHYIEQAMATAASIGTLLEEAVRRQEIREAELFDEDYWPVAGTDPVQHMTRFTRITDRLLPRIQEPILAADDRILFCAAVDRNGYLPTHNARFSQPQRRGQPEWNAANSRNRRIFNDKVGLSAARNTQPFLLQTYKRDMGGGTYVLMKDCSAPILVNGRHWGGFRIGYRV